MENRMDISYELNRILSIVSNHNKVVNKLSDKSLKKILDFIVNGDERIGICGFKEDVERCLSCSEKLKSNLAITRIFNQNDMICSMIETFRGEEQLKELSQADVDVMFVVTEEIRRTVEMYLFTYKAKYRLVDLYDFLEYFYKCKYFYCNHFIQKKIIVKFCLPVYAFLFGRKNNKGKIYDFLKYCKDDIRREKTDNYDGIFVKRKFYETSSTDDLKEYYLRNLIINYIKIKDLQSALKHIDEYISLDYFYKERFLKVKDELNSLINKISSMLQSRHKEDILIYWVDALSYNEFKDYNFLSEESKNGLFFTNSYTHIPYTHTAMQTMMMGVPFFEGKLYEYTETQNNVPYGFVLDLLKKNEYEILESPCAYINKQCNVEIDIDITHHYIPSPCNMWATIRKVILAPEKKYFIYVHCDCEPHHPYWGGDFEKMVIGSRNPLVPISNYKEQIQSALSYLEKQIRFYNTLWDNGSVKIFLSDHGKANPAYLEDRLHTFCFVQGKKIPNKVETRNFSYLNFGKLIQFIIDSSDDSYNQIFSDKILIQNEAPYGKNLIEDIIEQYKGDFQKIKNDFDKWDQFRGVIIGEYKYLCFSGGKELLLNAKTDANISIEEIETMDGGGVLTALKEAVKGPFGDIENSPHYQETKKFFARLDEVSENK